MNVTPEQSQRMSVALGQIELFSSPRPGKARNEDLVAAHDAAAWLLDGASAGDDPDACREHDAAWYVTHLSAALADALDAGPDADLRDLVAQAIAAVTDRHGTVHHHSDKRLSSVAPELRAEIRDALADSRGYDHPAHRARLAALRSHERAVRNTPGGYWIASDQPDAADHAITGSYTIGTGPGHATRVALLSDSLERAHTHLGLYSDWPPFLDALFERGVPACIAAARAAEAEDPSGVRHPRTAARDDASAVLVAFI